MKQKSNPKKTAGGRFRPYSEYRDSDLDWLDKIPKDWSLSRLRFIVKVNPPKAEVRHLAPHTLVSFIPMEAVREYGGLGLELVKEIREVQDGYSYFRNGDVVIAKITPCFENGKGAWAMGLENDVAFGTTELHVMRPLDSLDGRFLFYLTIAHPFREIGTSTMYGAGGQKRVPEGFIKDFVHPFPELHIQRKIVAFLDRETAKIDALISKKDQLIEPLLEKRSALITQAITRGLTPGTRMKDSGVEWLGEIPSHWRVKRLWHLTLPGRKIMYGIVLPGPNVDEGIPIVKGGDVSADRLKLELLNRTSFEIERQHVQSRLQEGDLVFAIRGSIGDVAMVPPELSGANLTQDAARISCSREIHGKWLLYALRSTAVASRVKAGALGATIKGINIRDLKRVWLPVPPPTEQAAIAEYLENEESLMAEAHSTVLKAIYRLKEFRSALISSAVTGMIDVREEAE